MTEKTGFRGYMPNGAYTESAEEYAKAWQALSEPIEKALGVQSVGWDPDLQFCETRPGAAPTIFCLPVSVAARLADLVQRKDTTQEQGNFEEAYLKVVGITVEDAMSRDVRNIGISRQMFQEGMLTAAAIVRNRGREVLGAINPEITARAIETIASAQK